MLSEWIEGIRRYLRGRSSGGPGGNCGACRHANHGTLDAEDGCWACPWVGGTAPGRRCRIRYRDTGRFVFEMYDGSNGTWQPESVFRSIPKGYEHARIEEV